MSKEQAEYFIDAINGVQLAVAVIVHMLDEKGALESFEVAEELQALAEQVGENDATGAAAINAIAQHIENLAGAAARLAEEPEQKQ